MGEHVVHIAQSGCVHLDLGDADLRLDAHVRARRGRAAAVPGRHPQRQHRYDTDDAEHALRRWGGLAGIGGSVLFFVVFAIVGIFAGPEPAGSAGPISRFPEIRVARTVENGLYLAVLALWVPLELALFHNLRRTRPASALFGSALTIFGLAVLAAGAIPHVVTSRLSDLYHADNATPDEQATLVLLWQANQAMFDALLLVGLLVMPVGIILFGLAMRRDPAFGKVAGTSAWRSASSGSPRRWSCWSIHYRRPPRSASSPSSASTSSRDGRPTASPRPTRGNPSVCATSSLVGGDYRSTQHQLLRCAQT